MTQLINQPLIVKKSSIHGYGVFAGKLFEKDETIEECYTILSEKIDKDRALYNYYFGVEGKTAILTGFGFIYNHADLPNATYYYDELKKVTVFKAREPIQKNEEIFITYGNDWFGLRNMPVKKITIWQRLIRFPLLPLFKASVVIGGLLLIICSISALTGIKLA